MSEQVRARLEALRASTDADSLTEVVRRALATFEVLWNARAEGKTVVVRDDDGEEQKVVFL